MSEYLKVESISHVECVEDDHGEESDVQCLIISVILHQKAQIQDYPSDQTGPELAEKLEVQVTKPGVQFTAKVEIIDSVPYILPYIEEIIHPKKINIISTLIHKAVTGYFGNFP